ncbi:MAG TPA: ribonuclease catalytic domain-containing protein, partial [Gemmatimonadaceae bacterium]|nr:ribonuclease catalytic domain-containing protein [Gemmatimonadaceae bacterium]
MTSRPLQIVSTQDHQPSVDFVETARRVLRENGFDPDFGAAVETQVESTKQPASANGVRDLRDLLWSSIDNTESRDLDQLEVAEELSTGAIRILVAVADVDALVTKDSPADSHAQENSTSVYTGVQVFPMLPEQFSTNLTSLNENADRVAVVIENVIEKNGDVSSFDVYRSIVRNKAQLAYDETGDWLENTTGGTVQPPEKVAKTQGLAVQLRLQWEAAKRLKAERERNGALELETIEATPVAKNGRVVDLTLTHKSAARDLIEDFMIASNIAIAKWLEARGRSGIRRIVREPERWARIVELASQYGETLPAEPDSLALAKFLAKRRAADPLRFPDL